MSTFWKRTKRRAIAVLAASAAGVAAAYCAYTWYSSYFSDNDTDSNNESDQPNNITSDQQPPPILLDPTGHSDSSKSDAEAHLKHHFDSIQDIADTTTLPSLLPPLSRALASSDDLDALLERLRLAKSGSIEMTSEEKKMLWNELAATSLARAVVSLWCLPLLNLQVRVQLNILGRHLYLETALADPMASVYSRQKSKRTTTSNSNSNSGSGSSLRFPFSLSNNNNSNTTTDTNDTLGGRAAGSSSSSSSLPSTSINTSSTTTMFMPTAINWTETAVLSPASQESFLSFTEHLTKEGHIPLMSHARHAAKHALSTITLDTQLDSTAFNTLLSTALDSFIKSAGHHGWVMYLLPSPHTLAESLRLGHPDDRALLQGGEQQLVDVDAVVAMMNEVGCVIDSRKFYDVAMVCAQSMASKFSSNLSQRFGPSQQLPLAKIVPILASESKRVLLNASNEWSSVMNRLIEVQMLCATVYSCGPPL